MQSETRKLYRLLEAGKKVTLSISSASTANNLRVSLHKIHQLHTAMDLTELSLCFDWMEEKKQAIFWLGVPRNRKVRDFTIISCDEISRPVGSDPNIAGTGGNNLSPESPCDIDSSDQKEESKSQCSTESVRPSELWKVNIRDCG